MSTSRITFPNIEFNTFESLNEIISMLPVPFTDCLADLLKDTIHIISSNQVYCYNQNNRIWEVYNGEQFYTYIARLLNYIGTRIEAGVDKLDKSQQKFLYKDAKKMVDNLTKGPVIKEVLNLLSGTIQSPEALEKMNNAELFLPIRDGKKIDLSNGHVSERTQADYFTFECPVSFTPNTDHANTFFEQIMPNDKNRELLRKVLGYSLTGDMNARKYFVWLGEGSNGKSAIQRLLSKILVSDKLYTQCPNIIFVKPSQVSSNDGPTPGLMTLKGRRVAVCSDAIGDYGVELHTTIINSVSGQDISIGRKLYGNNESFAPTCKLHIASNYIPKMNDVKSNRDRLMYLFFDTDFTEDVPTGPNQIQRNHDSLEQMQNEYLSEVFSWMVQGSIAYYRDKCIKSTPDFIRRTEEIFQNPGAFQNPNVSKFLRAKVVKRQGFIVKRADMYAAYKSFCVTPKELLSVNDLIDALIMQKCQYTPGNGHHPGQFIDVALKDDDDIDEAVVVAPQPERELEQPRNNRIGDIPLEYIKALSTENENLSKQNVELMNQNVELVRNNIKLNNDILLQEDITRINNIGNEDWKRRNESLEAQVEALKRQIEALTASSKPVEQVPIATPSTTTTTVKIPINNPNGVRIDLNKLKRKTKFQTIDPEEIIELFDEDTIKLSDGDNEKQNDEDEDEDTINLSYGDNEKQNDEDEDEDEEDEDVMAYRREMADPYFWPKMSSHEHLNDYNIFREW